MSNKVTLVTGAIAAWHIDEHGGGPGSGYASGKESRMAKLNSLARERLLNMLGIARDVSVACGHTFAPFSAD